MTDFASLILTGNLKAIQAMLVDGFNPETKIGLNNSWGPTPLIYACWNCTNWHDEKASRLVGLLVKHKASVSTQDKFGDTALINAVLSGNYTFVQALLSNGATPTSGVLYYAVARNDPTATEMLIEAGATVDLETIDNIGQFMRHDYVCDLICLKTYKLQFSIGSL